MKKFITNTLFFVLVFTVMGLLSCGSDSSEDGPGDPSDVNGTWSGTWQSSYGISGTFSANIVQDYSNLSGTIDVPYISLNNAVLKGSVSGSSITFGDVNNEITFRGTIGENSSSGTYVYPSMGDQGTWTALKNDAGTEPITEPGIIFSDDFDRPDSAAVGNGWNEAEGNGDIGKENDISISSYRLVFLGGYESTYCDIPSLSRTIDVVEPLTAGIVFSVDDSSNYYLEFMIYKPGNSLLNNYSVIFQSGGDISIEKNGTFISLTGSYPLTAGYVYFVFLTFDHGEITVDINDEYGVFGYYNYTDAEPLTEFTLLMLSGGWHDGTNAYRTYVDSVFLDFL